MSAEQPAGYPAPGEPGTIDALLHGIATAAAHHDREGTSVRSQVADLARVGLGSLGAPNNANGGLPEQVRVLADLAGRCLSTAFSLWAHRMTLEYLRRAATPWSAAAADELTRGESLGVTAMASAFKYVAGCGDVDLTASPHPAGWVVSGELRWASNLHSDSIMVTAARTPDGVRLVLGMRLDTRGIRIGRPFDLLGLGSTDSSQVALDRVVIPTEQVLTDDLAPFLAAVRPTFLLLQSALCLGLARRSLDAAASSLTGVNASLTNEVQYANERWQEADIWLRAYAAAVGAQSGTDRVALLRLRLSAADLATTAAGIEIRTAGGRGYARSTDASRRYREAAFLPVQSPSETQLRWELDRLSPAPRDEAHSVSEL